LPKNLTIDPSRKEFLSIRFEKKKKSPTLPIMDRSNGITLFQGKTTLEYIEHLKNLEIYGK
jgi:hypothetical protein